MNKNFNFKTEIENIFKSCKNKEEFNHKLWTDGFEGDINIVWESCQQGDFKKAWKQANADGWL